MQDSVGIKIDLDKANIWRSSGLNQEYLTRYKSILNPPERNPWATSLRCCTNLKGAYIPSLVRLELKPLRGSETCILRLLGYIGFVDKRLFYFALIFIKTKIFQYGYTQSLLIWQWAMASV